MTLNANPPVVQKIDQTQFANINNNIGCDPYPYC